MSPCTICTNAASDFHLHQSGQPGSAVVTNSPTESYSRGYFMFIYAMDWQVSVCSCGSDRHGVRVSEGTE